MRTTNYAKEILNNFKLGQTEVGSFVINIDIQVVDDKNEQLDMAGFESNASIEHKVVKRIGNALRQIDDVANRKVKLEEMLPDAYQEGVTANICDALLKLKPETGDMEIDAKIRYASSITRKPGELEYVGIKGNHFYVMQEISDRYKYIDLTDTVSIRGNIAALKKIKKDSARFEREITLNSFVDGANRSVKLELSEDDYRKACDAHRDGYEVRVRGRLDMGKRTWESTHIDDFEVIDN